MAQVENTCAIIGNYQEVLSDIVDGIVEIGKILT